VVGPNVNNATSTNNGTLGDTDLSSLVGLQTNDASVLEFDFVPKSNQASFQYVFSSEEYNEFVRSTFDDVFGFFVDGQNCATIGGIRVSVNSINNGNPYGSAPNSHPELFINNEISTRTTAVNTEMDGLTVVLTCTAPVTANATNHAKLAIADTSDSVLGSNVFFAGATLSAAEPPPPGTQFNNPPISSASSTDPVNTYTGNFGYEHTDIVTAGRGLSPVLVRSYNSNDTRVSPLGAGWTHNFNMHLANPGDGSSDLILTGPLGRSDRFGSQASSSFTAPAGVATTLARNPDGTYTATQPDQTRWIFRGDGKLSSMVDRYGNTSTLSYNAAGQLSSVNDPASRGTLSFAYDATSGLLTTITDWSNRVVRYTYDANGRLHMAADRNNQITTYQYDGTTQHLTSLTDANNHVAVSMTYDPQGRVQYQWDAKGINAAGQRTELAYGPPDGQGNVTTTVTYPITSFDQFAPQQIDTYNSQGQITRHISKPSATETLSDIYQYTGLGFRSQVTDARGNTTSLCYDTDYAGAAVAASRGNLTRAITPPPLTGGNPLVMLMKYDAKNNVVETVAPKGVANGAAVTCSTNLNAAINAGGLFVTDLAYDATLGTELVSVTRKYSDPDLGPQTGVTKFEYADSANPGLVTRVIPPRGNTGPNPDYTFATSLTYATSGSEAGMLLSATDPLGNQTGYTYDAVGRRTSLSDPLGHAWTFTYDSEDRLTQATAPAPVVGGAVLTTSAAFDPVGNRLSLTDANGQITRYQFDVRDSVAEVDQSATLSDPNADTAKIRTLYSYDGLGNLARVDRAAGHRRKRWSTTATMA
jgi:YD repeat-containing protein